MFTPLKITLCFLLCLLSFRLHADTKIKVGSSPVVSSAGIYLAQEKGYFKDEGLDVELIAFQNSGAPMTLLLSRGELDVGAGNISAGLFNAINRGEKFKIVADKGSVTKGREYIALIVRKDHLEGGRYKTLQDIKGMKFSFTSLDGVSQQAVMSAILKKAGLTENDIEQVKLSYAEANMALKTKNLDGAVQLEPYLTKAILEGYAVKVLTSQAVLPEQQSAAVFYSPDFAAKKESAIKFMKAYIRGVRYYNLGLRKPEVWRDVVMQLKKHIKIEDEAVWNKMIPVGLHKDGKLYSKSLQKDVDWFKIRGYIQEAPGLSEYYDPSFAEAAVRQLKKPR